MTDIDQLEALANAASQGTYFVQHPNAGDRGFEVANGGGLNTVATDMQEADARFFAAANPEAILELIERLRAAETTGRDIRADAYFEFLHRRGIDVLGGDQPCKRCDGFGVRGYGSTTTWRGGAGGQIATEDICDTCWGSGSDAKPWLNLRKCNPRELLARSEAAEAEVKRLKSMQPRDDHHLYMGGEC